jgi:hypothetical protein
MRLLKVSFIAGILGLAAHAGIIYDNITGVTSFDRSSVGVNNLYDSFTAPSNSSLTGLEMILDAFTPADGGSITIALYADSSTSAGSLIATLATVNDSALPSTPTIEAITLGSNPSLTAGTRYWIGISTSNASSIEWSYEGKTGGGIGVSGEYWERGTSVAANSPAPSREAYQMQLTTDAGSSAPEPSSALLITGGAGLIWWFGRRRVG